MSNLRHPAVLWVLLLLVLSACRDESTPPDLHARLLTVSDLPPGWATDTAPPPGKGNEPACLSKAQADLHSMQTAQARLVGGTYLPAFTESLSYFGRTSAASAALTRVSDALTACSRLAFQGGRTSYTGGIGPTLTAGLGSDARAWRLRLRGSDGSVIGGYLVVARHDAIVLFAIVADSQQPVRMALLALPTMAYSKIT
jgi:hypothetical protein